MPVPLARIALVLGPTACSTSLDLLVADTLLCGTASYVHNARYPLGVRPRVRCPRHRLACSYCPRRSPILRVVQHAPRGLLRPSAGLRRQSHSSRAGRSGNTFSPFDGTRVRVESEPPTFVRPRRCATLVSRSASTGRGTVAAHRALARGWRRLDVLPQCHLYGGRSPITADDPACRAVPTA